MRPSQSPGGLEEDQAVGRVRPNQRPLRSCQPSTSIVNDLIHVAGVQLGQDLRLQIVQRPAAALLLCAGEIVVVLRVATVSGREE